MMLMDDRQVAVNDVIIALLEAADHYRDGAEFLDEPELSELFAALADEREAMADELGAHVRNLGALPRKPDPERELVQRLANRFRAALSPCERAAIIEERIEAEKHIGSLLAVAAAQDLPDSTQRYLETCEDEVRAARQRLAARKPPVKPDQP